MCSFSTPVTLSLIGQRGRLSGVLFFLSLGRKGGQASSEDLLPLGYGEWDRIKVRVKLSLLSPSLQLSPARGREKTLVALLSFEMPSVVPLIYLN